MSVTDKIVEIRMIEKYEVKNILCVYDVDKKIALLYITLIFLV